MAKFQVQWSSKYTSCLIILVNHNSYASLWQTEAVNLNVSLEGEEVYMLPVAAIESH